MKPHDLIPSAVTDSLPDDPNTLKAILIAERAQNDRLRQGVYHRKR